MGDAMRHLGVSLNDSPDSVLAKFQTYHDRQFSDFEFFEQIQVIPFDFAPATSNHFKNFF